MPYSRIKTHQTPKLIKLPQTEEIRIPLDRHPQSEEDFLLTPSKVNDVLQFMDIMANANKMEDTASKDKTQKPVEVDISASVTDTNFLVTKRNPYTDRISLKRSKSRTKAVANTNQMTFMRQIDQTMPERVLARKERERVAENFRRLGNHEYRRSNFDIAVTLYTKGLTYINDTPVLYVNRAITYIKLRSYTRAIMDCDYILNNLDGKYLRAWLYRGGAYKRLNDERNFEESIYNAKRLNSKESEYIELFLDKMRTLL